MLVEPKLMKSRRSGLSLVIAGLLGGAFFWLTDPRFSPLHPGRSDLIDAAQQARIGTWVGLLGSGIILLIGLWLLSRRTV